MSNISSMSELGKAAKPIMDLCKTCSHSGIAHLKDVLPGQRKDKLDLGKCNACTNCKQFVPLN